MKIIAHRGLLDGPSTIYENCILQIERAIENFDVEIDLRYEFERFYLGHDEGTYLIDFDRINNWSERRTIYLHCKTIPTLQKVLTISPKSNIIPFYHDKDDCILLLDGTIWVHPNSKESAHSNPHFSIFVLPNLTKAGKYIHSFGVCTDYPIKVKESIL